MRWPRPWRTRRVPVFARGSDFGFSVSAAEPAGAASAVTAGAEGEEGAEEEEGAEVTGRATEAGADASEGDGAGAAEAMGVGSSGFFRNERAMAKHTIAVRTSEAAHTS